MAGSDDLKFQMMGLGGPPAGGSGPAPAKAPAGAAKKDAGYPTFEGLLGDKAKYDALVDAAAKSMARLEELADKGASAQAKADARKALRAFDHALELLKKGIEITAKIAKERQAKAKVGAKK
jgi:hypothetical protein